MKKRFEYNMTMKIVIGLALAILGWGLLLPIYIYAGKDPVISETGGVFPGLNGSYKRRSATPASAATSANALFMAHGNIWGQWTGNLDFLSGTMGVGTEENPYQITTKAQLMGLSELASMGMTVSRGAGKYPGDYSEACFKLTKDIDLGGMKWIPIGFYRNEAEMDGELMNSFSGSFDGNGKRISNFRIDRPEWRYLGFFGALDQAVVMNLTLEPSGSIVGRDYVGILAGSIEGSTVKDVYVHGDLRAHGSIGGVAALISDSVIENCSADITADSTKVLGNESIFVGGIAGKASDSVIVDTTVETGNNRSSRLQGQGYVGGITGFQNNTYLYKTEVKGTVGGVGCTAVGGITGLYHAGRIKVARFEGRIGSSGLGSRTHEGTFIGTRQTADHFVYGEDVAYLFADTESKVMAGVCGSDVPDDNAYTYEDHIGFRHGGDLYYTLVQGGRSKTVSDQYFYEELEDGILAVMDRDLGGSSGTGYSIDHVAPDQGGNPARGYLVFVPQIDTAVHGVVYTNVAALNVKSSSSYGRPISKNVRGAIAAGDIVTVVTAPEQNGDARYQIPESGNNPDRTHNYVTYTGEDGDKRPVSYKNGGTYSFIMPANDVEVTAVYEKVATRVSVSPHEYNFKVIQKRTGNRKEPTFLTKVLDNEGRLAATYLNGTLTEAKAQPVYVTAVVDFNNEVADNRVKWSLDDTDLIVLQQNEDEDGAGYTSKSAAVQVNLDAGFFVDTVRGLEKEQAESGFRNRIPDTIYGAGHQSGGTAVLTASTRPEATFEQRTGTDNCRINVTFQIQDQTYVANEEAVLDKPELEFVVTRLLTGDRLHPLASLTVTEPQLLTATFTPDYFSKKDVRWVSEDTSVVQVSFDDKNSEKDKSYRYAAVSAVKDTKWVQDIIASDQGIHENDPYTKLSGKGEKETLITVAGTDKLGRSQTAFSKVKVLFRTDDRTEIIPEELRLDRESLSFDLSVKTGGNIGAGIISESGFDGRRLLGLVLPKLDADAIYGPFNKTVQWSSSDSSVIRVDQTGEMWPVREAQWIKEAMKKAPYTAEKEAVITAETKDGHKKAMCAVKLCFHAACIEIMNDHEDFEIVLTADGRKSDPEYRWSGISQRHLLARVYPESQPVVWTSSDPLALLVDKDGNIDPLANSEWMKEGMRKYPYTADRKILIGVSTEDGKQTDSCLVTLKFKFLDRTYSDDEVNRGSGGSSGSGGTVRPGRRQENLDGAGGEWRQDMPGLAWRYRHADGTFAAGQWERIFYGKSGEWYFFGEDGIMSRGWHTDPDGSAYFLHDKADGTQGYMYTGWHQIDGKWFCFNTVSNGLRGAVFRNEITPDGWKVNAEGVWVE